MTTSTPSFGFKNRGTVDAANFVVREMMEKTKERHISILLWKAKNSRLQESSASWERERERERERGRGEAEAEEEEEEEKEKRQRQRQR